MKQLMYRLTSPLNQPHWWQDLLLALPRILGGLGMTVMFGAPKFGVPWSPADRNLGLFEVAYWFPEDVAEYGGLFKVFPVFFAWMGGFTEAVGGVAWILGFQTRIFSFLMAITMLVAALAQQWDNGIWAMLPAFSFLWISIYTLVLGSGRFGVDHLIARGKEQGTRSKEQGVK